MKRQLSIVLIAMMFLPLKTTKAFVGFGVYGGYDMASVSAGTYTEGTGLTAVSMDRDGFDNAFGGGGYLYIDAIPFIDLEADLDIAANSYQFQFTNAAGSLDPVDFGWARTSGYLTVRRKIFGLGLPIVGGAKLHAGGGVNMHYITPLSDIDMVTELLGGDLVNGSVDNLEDNIVDYLNENKIAAQGVHFQVGLQLKLFVLDAFLNYRYTIADDIFPDQSSFGSLNLRLGLGF